MYFYILDLTSSHDRDSNEKIYLSHNKAFSKELFSSIVRSSIRRAVEIEALAFSKYSEECFNFIKDHSYSEIKNSLFNVLNSVYGFTVVEPNTYWFDKDEMPRNLTADDIAYLNNVIANSGKE